MCWYDIYEGYDRIFLGIFLLRAKDYDYNNGYYSYARRNLTGAPAEELMRGLLFSHFAEPLVEREKGATPLDFFW